MSVQELLEKLRDEDYLARQAFLIHCESIFENVPVYYSNKTVSTLEELWGDFPEISDEYKIKVINECRAKYGRN